MGTQLRAEQSEFGGAWEAFTPVWTSLTVGNSVQTGYYIQIGKTVHFRIYITLGSTGSVGSVIYVNLPVPAVTTSATNIGTLRMLDTGTALYVGLVSLVGTAKVRLRCIKADSTYLKDADIAASTPFTWATGDTISIAGTYEAA